jgi:eukaryotic-like serine/threonine-protein kinase
MTLSVNDALQEGAIVLQQWQLVRPLGEGGMGSVWEATSLRLGSRVAIKFLSRQHLQDSGVRARFQREARAISKIDSPYVVRILDHGVFEDATPFIVTELLEGEDLRRLLDREQRLSVSEAGEILDQLCRGLHAVHAAGLVHRDVKPDNVYVGHDAQGRPSVKLLDFGVVKQLSGESFAMTAQNMVVGTAHYLSPEQILSPAQVDHRVDIWALGVLVHRMLTGALPYDADGWPALCLLLMAPPPVSARAIWPSLPQAVDSWLARTLNADPKQRFQTVEAAREAFARIASDHTSGVIARPTLPSERERRPQPARPARASIFTRFGRAPLRWSIALFALLLATLVGLRLVRRADPAPLVQRVEASASGIASPTAATPPPPAVTPERPAPHAEPPAASSPPPTAANTEPDPLVRGVVATGSPESRPPEARPRRRTPKSAAQAEPVSTTEATGRKYRGF